MGAETEFLAGVIEGFYGPPWSQDERIELFDRLAAWGLDTYLYAPKDDLKHRAIWREPYSQSEADALAMLIRECKQRNLRFVYALSPGLDVCYSSSSDREKLQHRFHQISTLGCQHVCLLFDDIPDRIEPADLQRWGSLASAQSAFTNAMAEWWRREHPRARFLFCPTPYCGRMAERQHGGPNYLEIIGRELEPEIDVFWTGPEIISREITVGHIEELSATLRRKPLIWDNLHANDYDGRRFYCGPYHGRPPALRGAVSGILSNPNTEFPLNYVALRTLAQFVGSGGTWDPRQVYLQALKEWSTRFDTVGLPLRFEDLTLFADCFYLPHEEGAEAESLIQAARQLLKSHPAEWGEAAVGVRQRAARLRDFCARLTDLKDRPLLHALSRRAWDLREEMDLLEKYIAFRSDSENADLPFRSDFHLPLTYRGGMMARLQRLLAQGPDGTFQPTQ